MVFKAPSAGQELLCSEHKVTCGWTKYAVHPPTLGIFLTAECRSVLKLVGLWLGRNL